MKLTLFILLLIVWEVRRIILNCELIEDWITFWNRPIWIENKVISLKSLSTFYIFVYSVLFYVHCWTYCRQSSKPKKHLIDQSQYDNDLDVDIGYKVFSRPGCNDSWTTLPTSRCLCFPIEKSKTQCLYAHTVNKIKIHPHSQIICVFHFLLPQSNLLNSHQR